jgi:hypothetical protein
MSYVDEHKKVEEWADALLDQHRTAPRESAGGAAPAGDSSSAVDGLLMRLSTKLNGRPPDPEIRERMRGHRERYAPLARLEAVGAWISIAALCAAVFIVSSLAH